MVFGEVTQIWSRRRLLTATFTGLALVSLVAAVSGLPRTYQGQGSVLLLASPAASRPNGGNPYLSFTPSLSLAADAVSRELMAPLVVQQLAARGFAAAYTVGLPAYTTPTTGSVLVVTVTGSDKAAVESTLQAVLGEVRMALAGLQGQVRPQQRIRLATLSVSPEPTLAVSQTARPIVVLGIGGLLVAFGLPVVIDGWLSRRRIRQGFLPEPAR
jgi:hypothetical protein